MLQSLIWLGLNQLAGQPVPETQPPSLRPTTTRPAAGNASQLSLAADCPTQLTLSPAQEFVYRGTFQEDFLNSQVQHGRSWRVESRFLILGEEKGFKVAGFTQIRPKDTRSPGAARDNSPRVEEAGSAASHVHHFKVAPNGQTHSEEKSDRPVSLEGLPLRQLNLFVGLPLDSTQANDGWKSQETGRPDWNWTLVGREAVQGTRCIVLEGVQTPPEWEKPRADRQSWQRKAKVWISMATGLVHRFEKTYERKDPARAYVSLRTVHKGELDSTLGYPGQLFEDRRKEALLAFQSQEETLALVDDYQRNTRALDSLARQLKVHMGENPTTPYRVAIQGVLRKIELAKKGELPPRAEEEVAGSDNEPGPAIGKVAQDFLVPSLDKPGTVSLRNWKNKPILMLFYHPDSQSAVSCLSFAEQIQRDYKGKVQVLGLSVVGDARKATIQKETMKLSFPLMDGGGLKISYGLESTPRWVLMDQQMIIRALHSGWGDEIKGDLSRQAAQLASGK